MSDICITNAIADLDGAYDFDALVRDLEVIADERSGGDKMKAARAFIDLLDDFVPQIVKAKEREMKAISYSYERRSRLIANVKQFINLGKNAVRAVEGAIEMGLNSADYRAKEAIRVFEAEIKRENLDHVMNDKSRQEAIATEIGELNKRKGNPGVSGDKDAAKIAKIYETYIQAMRADLARVGVKISNLEGRIVRQMFGPDMLIKTGKDDFVNDIIGRVDVERTFGRSDVSTAEVKQFLELYYERVTRGLNSDVPVRPFDLDYERKTYARKISESRELHLKGPSDVLHSINKYTGLTLPQIMLATLRDTYHDGTMVLEFGPNIKNTTQSIRESAKDLATTPGEKAKINNVGSNMVIVATRDFYSNGIYNPNWANAAKIANGITRATFLQLSGIAAIGDGGTSIVAASRIGAPAIKHTIRQLEAFTTLSKADPDTLKAAIAGAEASSAHATSLILDNSLGNTPSSFLLRASSKMSDFTMTWSGLRGVTNKFKEAAALSLKAQLYSLRGKKITDLPKGLQFVLARAGMTEAEWNVIRSSGDTLRRDILGTPFFDLYKVGDISDADIKRIAGDRATKNQISNAREELKRKMLSAAAVFADDAVPTPGIKERSIINMGTNPGTMGGALTHVTTSLLGYPITYLYRVMGRTNEVGNYLSGYSALLISSLVAGTISDFLWNAAQGRMRDYSVLFQNHGATTDFLASAITRGGFGGIYTSLLLDYAMYGKNPENVVAGAPITLLSDVTGGARDTVMDIVEGDMDSIIERTARALTSIPGAKLPLTAVPVNIGLDFVVDNLYGGESPIDKKEKNFNKRNEGSYFINN